MLVAGGPEYAGAESVYRSPLGAVLPGAPTARVVEEGFVPRLTDLGQRHPVTEGLEELRARGPPPRTARPAGAAGSAPST